MATAGKPLRGGGPRPAANVPVCGWGGPPLSPKPPGPVGAGPGLARGAPANARVGGWGPPPLSHNHAVPMVAALGLALHRHSTEFRFHAIEQQRGQIFSARSNADTGGIKDAEDYRTALLSDSPQVSF